MRALLSVYSRSGFFVAAVLTSLAGSSCSSEPERRPGPADEGTNPGGASGDGPAGGGTSAQGGSSGGTAGGGAADGGGAGTASGGSAGAGAGPSQGGSSATGPSETPPEDGDSGAGCNGSAACTTFCQGLADGDGCGLSDADVPRCVCRCEETTQADCAAPLASLLACGGDPLSLSCESGVAAVEGCTPESRELELCIEEHAGRLCAQQHPHCQTFCDAVLSADCEGGPPNLSDCLCGCEEKLAGRCTAAWTALTACSGDTFDVACNQDGAPVVEGACAAEWLTLEQCL